MDRFSREGIQQRLFELYMGVESRDQAAYIEIGL